MNKLLNFTKQERIWWLLVLLLAIRVVAMIVIPLNDPTEARYAEIARLMLESKNFITPMHHYGIPFWAKPPLSMWASAAAMFLFGVNVFAARLPSLLFSLGILWLLWDYLRQKYNSSLAYAGLIILCSSLYFILGVGTVMTESALLFANTLITIAFWRAVMKDDLVWGYIFFIACAIGLLAKGPVALVLTGLPIIIWVSITKKWLLVWRRLPWALGIILLLMLALPWYIAAERATTGFLQYFIIGEHIQRFITPGWVGDKYGFAHSAPIGMIWCYALLGFLPWSIFIIFWCLRKYNRLKDFIMSDKDYILYWLLLAFFPIVFFTFARNIIYTYVFISLLPFAVFVLALINWLYTSEYVSKSYVKKHLIAFSLIIAGVCVIVTMLFVVKPNLVAKSQDIIIASMRRDAKKYQEQPKLIYWNDYVYYSAEFYAGEEIFATIDSKVLCNLLANDKNNYVVTDSEMSVPLPQYLDLYKTVVDKKVVLRKTFTLYKIDKGYFCES